LNSKKKILIIGGTGFIGYHLAKKAISNGWLVSSISSNKVKKIRNLKKVKYLICDITNKNKLKKIIKQNYDYVVNLGGYVNHTNKIKTLKSHFNGCKNLAEIFLNKKIKSFVQMGSSVEYGHAKSPQNEEMKCTTSQVNSTYGKAKLLATKHLIELYKKYKFPATVLRLYLTYGEKQDVNRFLPIVINSCIKNQSFPCSHGNQFRDFVYIDDLVDAIIKSLKNKKAQGQIFNIGSGKPKNIKKLIKMIKKKCKGGKPQFGMIKLRKDEIKSLYPKIIKVKKMINWKPKINFEKGLQKTIKSYYA